MKRAAFLLFLVLPAAVVESRQQNPRLFQPFVGHITQPLPVTDAAQADPVERAIKALGGDAALERARSVSIVMVGTQNLKAIDQGYFAARSSPQRQQETLIIDEPSRRAVIRTEGINSDGSPTIWRNVALGDSGFRLKVKTGSVSRMGKEQTAEMYANLRWMVPQLALTDMRARRDKLRCGETRAVGKQIYEVCRFESDSGTLFSVLFSKETGELVGYEYTSLTMRGSRVMRYEFKPYVQTSIGLLPSGYRFIIGDEVFRDQNVIDAQPAALENHPWFVPPPADARPVSSVPQQTPAAIEEVAAGVWFLRNVAGYNVMVARIGDCAAVFDAPASYGHFGGPIPGGGSAPDRSEIILNRVREVTGLKVCYVIPTHHHNDHFGGIAGFARAGATIITTPGNLALARETIRAAGVSIEPKIQLVQEKLTLGSGAERIDVWVIRNDPHAEEMIFIHLPGRGIAFEGDLVDYVPSAWNFLRFVGQKSLKIDRVFSSHSSRPHTLREIQWEEPGN